MLDPTLTRQIVAAMTRRVTRTEVSVKCRIGVTGRETFDQLVEFIDNLYLGGVRKVVVHARKCILRGLSPAQNRVVPPLDYAVVRQLIPLFPEMRFVLNGGVETLGEAASALEWTHGVMVGRAAYNLPMMFAAADSQIFSAPRHNASKSRIDVLEAYVDFASAMHDQAAFGSGYPNLCKPMHNFFNDCPDRKAVKQYKQALDATLKDETSKSLPFQDLIWDVVNLSFTKDFLEAPLLADVD